MSTNYEIGKIKKLLKENGLLYDLRKNITNSKKRKEIYLDITYILNNSLKTREELFTMLRKGDYIELKLLKKMHLL